MNPRMFGIQPLKKNPKKKSKIKTLQTDQQIISLDGKITYSNTGVIFEKAIGKPHDGTQCEEEGQGKRHEFDALGSNHFGLKKP